MKRRVGFFVWFCLLFFSLSLFAPPIDAEEVEKAKEKNSLDFSVSIRPRWESSNNTDLDKSKDDYKSFVGERVKFSVFYNSDTTPVLLELRKTRLKGEPLNTLEFYQGYADLGKDLKTRIGRQEIDLGSGRLVSSTNWSNAGRNYDGVRFSYKSKYFISDMLFVHPVKYHQFQDFGEELVYGPYLSFKDDNKNQLDTYLLFDYRKGGGYNKKDLNIGNVGLRYKKEWGSFKGEAEGVYQFGRDGDRTQSAFAYFLGVEHSWKGKMKPALRLRYDVAEGDLNPDDDTSRSFYVMHGKRHRDFGFMDLVGQRNVRDFMVGASITPMKDFLLSGDYHCFTLYSPKDSWCLSNGREFLRDPTGKSGTDMGNELDLTLQYKKDAWDITTGYSHFYPGKFVRSIKAKNTAPADWFYLSVEYKL